MIGWDEFRKQMPVAADWAYLDHAAVAPLPRPSAVAIGNWSHEISTGGDVHWPKWHRRVEEVRTLMSNIVHADPEEIALIPNTTAGISLVAEGFPWRSGENVVTLSNEFPSNLYPWQNLAPRGVETRLVEADRNGRFDLQRLLEACDAKTRIVSISWIGYGKGFRASYDQLGELVQAVHRRGAYVFLDAIQGLGVFPLNVRQIPIDFFAADGHKWMLGPEGAGVFYVRREHLDLLRPIGVGWNSVVHRFDFSRHEIAWRAAARYEGGTLNTAGFLALAESLQLLLDAGLTADQSPIADQILSLTEYAVEQLCTVDAEIVSDRSAEHASGVVAFRFPFADHAQTRERLMDAGVVLSNRSGCLRISPHAYNSPADIDRLIETLRQLRSPSTASEKVT